MPTIKIPYGETGFFSPLIVDYLSQKPVLKEFFGHFPTLENFGKQIAQRQFPDSSRLTLAAALRRQYAHLSPSLGTMANITALENQNTYTVTTGHQLNLFTGPLYFLLKIIDAILLARALAEKYPNQYFVPVYWMATEDHDFAEIDHFNFKGRRYRWQREAAGAVGRMDTAGLEKVFEEFSADLGPGINAERLRELFQKSYLEHDNLADATRYLANELFGEHGLVIVDGDDRDLKEMFIPVMKRELETEFSYGAVTHTNQKLGYPAQVHPRENNLFYLGDGFRSRIARDGEGFGVVDTDINFTSGQIQSELQNHPERFSPNVILRPLYQEIILPNLCYIGGGGELAYWLQLKKMFESADVDFPLLMLRDSVMLASEKQDRKRQALGLEWSDLFENENHFTANLARKHSKLQLDFSSQKAVLEKQFDDLLETAKQTHPSFLGAVMAQKVRQLKGLENLEKRLLRAEKKQLEDVIARGLALKGELFPGGGLQERKENFAAFYLEFGESLVENLMKSLDPLDPNFRIIIAD